MPKLLLKKSNTSGASPANLDDGELAINVADSIVYAKDINGEIANITGALLLKVSPSGRFKTVREALDFASNKRIGNIEVAIEGTWGTIQDMMGAWDVYRIASFILFTFNNVIITNMTPHGGELAFSRIAKMVGQGTITIKNTVDGGGVFHLSKGYFELYGLEIIIENNTSNLWEAVCKFKNSTISNPCKISILKSSGTNLIGMQFDNCQSHNVNVERTKQTDINKNLGIKGRGGSISMFKRSWEGSTEDGFFPFSMIGVHLNISLKVKELRDVTFSFESCTGKVELYNDGVFNHISSSLYSPIMQIKGSDLTLNLDNNAKATKFDVQGIFANIIDGSNIKILQMAKTFLAHGYYPFMLNGSNLAITSALAPYTIDGDGRYIATVYENSKLFVSNHGTWKNFGSKAALANYAGTIIFKGISDGTDTLVTSDLVGVNGSYVNGR